MASVEEDIMAIILAADPVTDIIDDRAYWNLPPQDAAHPFLVISQVGRETDHTLNETPKLDDDLWQFSSFGATLEDARELASAVRTALEAFEGAPGGTTFQLDGESTQTDDPRDGAEKPAFQIIQTFAIMNRGTLRSA